MFGQANVMAWLDCSKSKATNVMNALKQAGIIEKVKGLGQASIDSGSCKKDK